jgi:hypothetical protein
MPTHASFRLITALRLYHSLPASVKVWSEEEMAAASRRWRDTILGHEEEVSEENERACRESMIKICEAVITRAERGTEAVKEAIMEGELGNYRNVLEAVKMLWLEEQAVARAMLVT